MSDDLERVMRSLRRASAGILKEFNPDSEHDKFRWSAGDSASDWMVEVTIWRWNKDGV